MGGIRDYLLEMCWGIVWRYFRDVFAPVVESSRTRYAYKVLVQGYRQLLVYKVMYKVTAITRKVNYSWVFTPA